MSAYKFRRTDFPCYGPLLPWFFIRSTCFCAKRLRVFSAVAWQNCERIWPFVGETGPDNSGKVILFEFCVCPWLRVNVHRKTSDGLVVCRRRQRCMSYVCIRMKVRLFNAICTHIHCNHPVLYTQISCNDWKWVSFLQAECKLFGTMPIWGLIWFN